MGKRPAAVFYPLETSYIPRPPDPLIHLPAFLVLLVERKFVDDELVNLAESQSLLSAFPVWRECDRNFQCQTLKIRNVSLVVMGS
jgi:hypothetical protein